MFAMKINGEIVEELLPAGASPFLHKHYEGSNALMHLCRLVESPNPTLQEVFLALGVDPRIKKIGPALSIAVRSRHFSRGIFAYSSS